MEIIRACRKCGVEKPLSGFHKDKTKKYGHTTICKPFASNHSSEYYTKNSVRIRQRVTVYSHSHIPKHQRELLSKLKNLCTKARNRNRGFDIDYLYLKEIWDKQQGRCAYSGEPLSIEANQPTTMSLDRIDSSVGYMRGNVHLVCASVNRMKMDLPEEEFLNLCEIITNNRRRTTQTV